MFHVNQPMWKFCNYKTVQKLNFNLHDETANDALGAGSW